MSRYYTVRGFSKLTGYSEYAIHGKIDTKKWPKGGVWIRSPDGRRVIDSEGYELWVEGKELQLNQLIESR